MSNQQQQTKELKESFQWAPEEYIRFLRQTEAGSIYRVRAIHVSKTRNQVEFTEDELRVAARSLGYRPIDLNHVPPNLPFPENRVIDAEFEDARVEALISIREPSVMVLIEAKKIVAVSIEAQYRWADVVCDQNECWWQPQGVIFTGLALLTPGVEPGDPLASIVMKKIAGLHTEPVKVESRVGGTARLSLETSLKPASSVTGMPSREDDTTPIGGGVSMEKKEATPPPEPKKAKDTAAATQPATPVPAVQESKTTPEPDKTTEAAPPLSKETGAESDGKPHGAQECAKAILSEVQKLGDRIGSLESQVKLLNEQRRKGSRGT